MSRTYSFWRGSLELVKLFFSSYKQEHDTRIQTGGHLKMTKKKEEEDISKLVQLLGEEVGMIQAGYVYNTFSNRYDSKHETDNNSQEEYLKNKTLCWKNYLRAYYKIPKTKADLKEENRIKNNIKAEALKRASLEYDIDNINYKW
jgi:hypothetical protein